MSPLSKVVNWMIRSLIQIRYCEYELICPWHNHHSACAGCFQVIWGWTGETGLGGTGFIASLVIGARWYRCDTHAQRHRASANGCHLFCAFFGALKCKYLGELATACENIYILNRSDVWGKNKRVQKISPVMLSWRSVHVRIRYARVRLCTVEYEISIIIILYCVHCIVHA